MNMSETERLVTAEPISTDLIRSRLEHLDKIPTIPALLFPLIRQMDVPIEQVNVQKIVDLISHDKSLAAQCLHMANSPLFGRWRDIDTVRGAIVALGITRVRDIAMSCCLMRMVPPRSSVLDPCTLWEHSLGVALVSRRIARRIGFRDPEKAYLAGLLHDLGLVANLLLVPDVFDTVVCFAHANKLAIESAEREKMSFTHCFTGALLAEKWRLGPEICEVIERHHDPSHASFYRVLTALVHIADLVCRASGVGYGFAEREKPECQQSSAWTLLGEECRVISDIGPFISEMDLYAAEVKRLVAVLFRVNSN
jgi:putative nucleotidyltransferase with HDIG domain